MPRLSRAVADAASAALHIDRNKLAPDVGLRAATGIAIPLIAGQAAGHPVIGATAATGALIAGVSSLQGTYRSRAWTVLAAGSGFALAAFVGATVGHLLGPDIVLTAALGFGAGLLVCLGTAASLVGTQSVVGLIVFSQFHFPAAISAREAGIVFAGAIIQTLLVVILWPVGRFPAERRALGAAFDVLAEHSRLLSEGSEVLLVPVVFDQLAAIRRDPQPFGRGEGVAALQALVDQVDRLRIELVVVGRDRQLLARAGEEVAAAILADVLLASALVLGEVAAALRQARIPLRWDRQRGRVEVGIDELRRLAADQGRTAWNRALVAESARRVEAVAGLLRAVIRLAVVPAGGDPRGVEESALTGRPVESQRAQSPRSWVSDRAAILRANMTWTSQAFRHGLRVAGSLTIAVAASHAFGPGHRYWLPLTVMLVLRPDFASTFSRGLSRVAGTLAGAGLVTLAVAEIRPGPAGLTAMVIVLCFAATTTLQANYAIFSVCIASLVVTLLAFNGAPEASVAGERSLYTVIGAAVALLAYLAWPTWAATSLHEDLAELIDKERRYGLAVLAAWERPDGTDRDALERARADARLMRSNAEAAVDRWQAEPHRGDTLGGDGVLGIVAAVRNCVQGILSLHAGLPSGGPGHRELEPLAGGFDDAMGALSARLRTGESRPWPPLRSLQVDLARSLGLDSDSRSAAEVSGDAVVLAGETDLIVNAVNTMGHLVGLYDSEAGGS